MQMDCRWGRWSDPKSACVAEGYTVAGHRVCAVSQQALCYPSLDLAALHRSADSGGATLRQWRHMGEGYGGPHRFFVLLLQLLKLPEPRVRHNLQKVPPLLVQLAGLLLRRGRRLRGERGPQWAGQGQGRPGTGAGSQGWGA